MSEKLPRVSIGLPVRNGAEFLPQTLTSILRQTWEDFELIVSDNGSTDETPEICRQFATRDARIRYVRQDGNRGAAWNHNQVLALARGELFRWNADDDPLHPDALRVLVQTLETHPGAILAALPALHIGPTGRVIGMHRPPVEACTDAPHIRFRALACHGHDCSSAFGLLRIEDLRRTRGLGPYVAADRVLLAEIGLLGRFVIAEGSYMLRRIHQDSSPRCFRGRRAERVSWFDGGPTGRIVLPEWRLLREYASAIRRAPLSLVERMRCYLELGRWLKWGHLNMMLEDLRFALQSGGPQLLTGGRPAPQKKA